MKSITLTNAQRDKIKSKRKAIGMSIQSVANILMVCQTTVYDWERGHRNLTFEHYLGLMQLLNIDSETLEDINPDEHIFLLQQRVRALTQENEELRSTSWKN